MRYSLDESPQYEKSLLEVAKEEGVQTKVTESVLKVSADIDISGKLCGLELVKNVCAYVQIKLKPSKEALEGLHTTNPSSKFDKRARSADELLSPGNILPGETTIRNLDGCTDIAHVTRALLLAKGIPCLFTDTLKEEWLSDEAVQWASDRKSAGPVQGHDFLDVYIKDEGKWYTINPVSNKETVHEYQEYSINGKKYTNPITGKDSADIGFPTMVGFLDALQEALKAST